MKQHTVDTARDLGLLVLRLVAGGMMAFGHGLSKLLTFAEHAASFPDPLGVGSSTSLVLAIFAELVCSLAVALGLMTRLAALPVLFTMLVAVLVIHADDPWSKKEFALMYALPFLTIVFTGAGRFSVDAFLTTRAARRARKS